MTEAVKILERTYRLVFETIKYYFMLLYIISTRDHRGVFWCVRFGGFLNWLRALFFFVYIILAESSLKLYGRSRKERKCAFQKISRA